MFHANDDLIKRLVEDGRLALEEKVKRLRETFYPDIEEYQQIDDKDSDRAIDLARYLGRAFVAVESDEIVIKDKTHDANRCEQLSYGCPLLFPDQNAFVFGGKFHLYREPLCRSYLYHPGPLAGPIRKMADEWEKILGYVVNRDAYSVGYNVQEVILDEGWLNNADASHLCERHESVLWSQTRWLLENQCCYQDRTWYYYITPRQLKKLAKIHYDNPARCKCGRATEPVDNRESREEYWYENVVSINASTLFENECLRCKANRIARERRKKEKERLALREAKEKLKLIRAWTRDPEGMKETIEHRSGKRKYLR